MLDTVLGKNSAYTKTAGLNSVLDALNQFRWDDLRTGPALNILEREYSSIARSAGIASVLDSVLKKSNVVTPAIGIESILKTTDGLAGWHQSMLGARSATTLASMTGSLNDSITHPVLAELARTSSVTARLASTAAGSIALQPRYWPSQPPAIRLGHYLQGLQPEPSQRDVRFGVSAGISVSALLTSDVLSHEPDGDRRDHIIELFEDDVAKPWLDGPAKARAELLEVLGQPRGDLPDLLLGAWDDIERPGAAAAVKISTCTVEVLERTLRTLAPDNDVLPWHTRERRPSNEISNGRPTHGCRVRYILRDPGHQKHRQLLSTQVESIVVMVNQLRSILQGGKHASSGDLAMLRGCLLSVEAVLHQLTIALR